MLVLIATLCLCGRPDGAESKAGTLAATRVATSTEWGAALQAKALSGPPAHHLWGNHHLSPSHTTWVTLQLLWSADPPSRVREGETCPFASAARSKSGAMEGDAAAGAPDSRRSTTEERLGGTSKGYQGITLPPAPGPRRTNLDWRQRSSRRPKCQPFAHCTAKRWTERPCLLPVSRVRCHTCRPFCEPVASFEGRNNLKAGYSSAGTAGL